MQSQTCAGADLITSFCLISQATELWAQENHGNKKVHIKQFSDPVFLFLSMYTHTLKNVSVTLTLTSN